MKICKVVSSHYKPYSYYYTKNDKKINLLGQESVSGAQFYSVHDSWSYPENQDVEKSIITKKEEIKLSV